MLDGALAQVMKVFSADPCHSDTAEWQMHHHNHGCALAAIMSIVTNKHTFSSDTSTKKASNQETKGNKQEEEVWSGKKVKKLKHDTD
jgi:hypothetical protein